MTHLTAPSAQGTSSHHRHSWRMRYESTLSAAGLTTIPKRLRDQLHVPLGGRLVWEQLPDGSLKVTLKHAHVPPVHCPVDSHIGRACANR